MDSNRGTEHAREDNFPEEVAQEQLENAQQRDQLRSAGTKSDEGFLATPYDMDARDQTALIDAYERAVGTCTIEKSTRVQSAEEARLLDKSTVAPQEQLGGEDSPQPRNESSPESDQHEDQVLESDDIDSSQSGGNESDHTDDGKFVPIYYDTNAWDDTELVAAYDRAVEMARINNRAKNNKQRKRKRQEKHNTSQDLSLGNVTNQGGEPFTSPPAEEQGATERGAERAASCIPVPSRIAFPKLVPTHDWMAAIPTEVEPIRAAKRVKRSMNHGEGTASGTDLANETFMASPSHVYDSVIPPPPPAVLARQSLSPELEDLLKSWYMAGYRAGFAASKRTTE